MFTNLSKRIVGVLCLSYLIGTASLFYLSVGQGVFSNYWLGLVFLPLITDFLLLAIKLPKKGVDHKNLSCDPSKLTIIITAYISEDCIAETIQNAMVHVPSNQIIVVCDKTRNPKDQEAVARIARSMGTQVVINENNLNKALGISNAISMVKTPYVVTIDDDTYIGGILIPTSLLDDGYSAVAFNVMPKPTGKLVNKFQIFEYRKSMQLGKNLGSRNGAISNISGAIGLFRTEDLIHQAHLHSGQFGGEDQQRTILVNLYSQGKGVVFMDALVPTDAPDSWKSLYRQRAYMWNFANHELFWLQLREILSPRTHYSLKLERSYTMFLLLTDPMRIFLWIFMLSRPMAVLILYVLFAFLDVLSWLKTGRKDPLWIALLFPLYSKFNAFCRFIGHFWWFKTKHEYLFRRKFHQLIRGRKLVLEYAGVAVILLSLWPLASHRFVEARGPEITRGTINTARFIYLNTIDFLGIEEKQSFALQDAPNDSYSVTAASGDGLTHVSRMAIDKYLSENTDQLRDALQLTIAENYLTRNSQTTNNGTRLVSSGDKFEFSETEIMAALNYAFADKILAAR